MERKTKTTSAHVLLGVTLCVAAVSGAEDAAPPSIEPLPVERIADGAWLHRGRQEDMSAGNGGDIANVGFVVGETSVAVIDPGPSHARARALRAAVASVTTLPVSHLVITHAHPDHVLGAGVFADTPVIVAHARLARAVTARGDAANPRYAFALEPGVPLVVRPTVELSPGEHHRIDLGGRTLRVIAYPTSHTDNDVAVLDEAGGTLWAGDLVFEGRLPSLGGSLLGWLGTLDALAALEPALVVPGHGAPGPWATTVALQRAYLEALRDEIRVRVARGDALSDVVADAEDAVGPDAESDAGPDTDEAARIGRGAALFAMQHPANVTRAFVELEWE